MRFWQGVALLWMVSALAQAGELFSQISPSEHTAAGLRSQSLAQEGGHDQDVIAYDDFQVAGGAMLTKIVWRGSALDAQTLGFTLSIYAAQSTLTPDLSHPLRTQFIAGQAAQSRIEDGLFEFRAMLDKPLLLEAHTPYWISIVANQRTLAPWYWAHGVGENGKSVQFFNEYKMLPAAADRAFSLHDDVRP